jgi:uncharacterized protein (DUF983 family)
MQSAPASSPTPLTPQRPTDTPLEMPTLARLPRFLSRLFRLRCPHCGQGAVLKWDGSVLARCSSCHFRYQRGDSNYFFGAMFFGVMLGELLFAITFGIWVISSWPDVPWKVLQWVLPIGVLGTAPLFIPFSKVAFLSVDVFVRPVVPVELS